MPRVYRERDWFLPSEEDLSRALVKYTAGSALQNDLRKEMSGRRPPPTGRGAHVDEDLNGSSHGPPARDISEEESVSHSHNEIDPLDSASVDNQRAERPARRQSRAYVEDPDDLRRSPQPIEPPDIPERRPLRRTTQPGIEMGGPPGAAKGKKTSFHRDAEKLRSRFAAPASPEPAFSDADSYAEDYGWGAGYGRHQPPPRTGQAGFYGHRASSFMPSGYHGQMVPYNPPPFNPFGPSPETMPYGSNMAPHYPPSYISPAQQPPYQPYSMFNPPPPPHFHPPPPPPTEHPNAAPPVEVAKSKAELEMERLRAEMEAERRAREEAARRREVEESIRREADETMQRRMEATRRAQEDVRREIEMARQEAEAATRKRLEQERQAEEERRKVLAEERAKASAEERARVHAAIQAEEMAKEKRKEDEVRMLREAKEKALLELEAERERARRDEAERTSLLQELRAQVRQEMAAETARSAVESARASTRSRSGLLPRGGSINGRHARRVPPRPTKPPQQKFPPPPSARSDSGEEEEVIIEERDPVVDVSDSSSVHSSDSSSSSLKSWRRHNARRRRQQRKEDRDEIRMVGKELAKPIVEALVGRLPVPGGPYMPPIPAFYMQYPPLPIIRDTRRQQRELGNDYAYSRYSSDETDDSESDADTITPRPSRHHTRSERRIRSRVRNRDRSIASRDSMGNGRRLRKERAHSGSDSEHNKELRGSIVTPAKTPSKDTDGISKAPHVTAQNTNESKESPFLYLDTQSTTTDGVHDSSVGEDTDLPLPSTGNDDVSVKDDELGHAASSQISDETEKEVQTVPDIHAHSRNPPDTLPTEDNPSESAFSDNASVTVQPPTGSPPSRSPKSKTSRHIIVNDNSEDNKQNTTATAANKSHRTESPETPSSPRQQTQLEKREAKYSRNPSRNKNGKQKQRRASQTHDQNELNVYSPFGPGAFPSASISQAEQQILPVPFPYHYPQPYQLGIPRRPSSPGTYRREARSRDGGSRRDDRGGRIPAMQPVAFMSRQQPYGFLVMPSMFAPMMAPPPPPSY